MARPNGSTSPTCGARLDGVLTWLRFPPRPPRRGRFDATLSTRQSDVFYWRLFLSNAPLLVSKDTTVNSKVDLLPLAMDDPRVALAYAKAREDLLSERGPQGHWRGELASSPLATATAVSALSIVQRYAVDVLKADDDPNEATCCDGCLSPRRLADQIIAGVEYLIRTQNEDGGWGDTDRSLSNIATTMLVRAAFHLTAVPSGHEAALQQADAYIEQQGGPKGVRRRYGRDRTFAVPILANCALAGMVPWSEVGSLPFEMATLPSRFYRFLRLPVVSYAIPALVAVGQLKFHHAPPRNPLTRAIRRAAVPRSLEVLETKQPESGGFLEAIPLTSFVVMSLASIGQTDHPVTQRSVQFLLHSVREDGSWPIDADLATWVTTLSVGALAAGGEDVSKLGITDWLLKCQNTEVHPYTDAPAGGWGWTDLSGSVPDADDTSSALLALAATSLPEEATPDYADRPPREHLQPTTFEDGAASTADDAQAPVVWDERILTAVTSGVDWLLNLQNRNGGWPTFCRGWGKLPFDRSATDLTAHAIRALVAWHEPIRSQGSGNYVERRERILEVHTAIRRGFEFLARGQHADGSWFPLWFGNQRHPAEVNPIYGTAKVLLAYFAAGQEDSPEAERGLEWLIQAQDRDGGWGGAGCGAQGHQTAASVEETALALETLLAAAATEGAKVDAVSLQAAIERGLGWLVRAVESDRHKECSPIGFYFAKLWYYEKLYPRIFATAALGRAAEAAQVQGPEKLATISAKDRTLAE